MFDLARLSAADQALVRIARGEAALAKPAEPRPSSPAPVARCPHLAARAEAAA